MNPKPFETVHTIMKNHHGVYMHWSCIVFFFLHHSCISNEGSTFFNMSRLMVFDVDGVFVFDTILIDIPCKNLCT